MLITANFSEAINWFTLKFLDTNQEEEYKSIKHAMTNTYLLFKLIILIYAGLCTLSLVIVLILSYKEDDYRFSNKLWIILATIIFVWIVEYIIEKFSRMEYLQGILTIIESMIVYKFYFEDSAMDYSNPTGDIGIFIFHLLVGMNMCNNWIVASVSAFISYVIYIFFSLDGNGYSNSKI